MVGHRQRRRGRAAGPGLPATTLPSDHGPGRSTCEARRSSRCCPTLEGAFSLVMLDADHLYGVRDPHGFRPLCLGRLGPAGEPEGWVLASESPGPRRHRRDLRARARARRAGGDRREGVRSERLFSAERRSSPHLCIFEFVYFARPDTRLYGREVHGARRRMGELLAEQAPVGADMVMGVPDSGVPAAEGYARRSGIPYGQGLVKNRYIGRTFIDPDQAEPGERGAGASSTRCGRTSPASGWSWSTTPSSGARRPGRMVSDAPRRRRGRGAPADLLAAVPLALLLRHRHPRPRRAAGRRRDPRRDRAVPRGRLARPTSAWRT